MWERGWLFGQGLFETVAAFDRKPFLLDEHVCRLKKSAEILDISIPSECTTDKVRDAIEELLNRNGLCNAYVRIMLTAGISQPPENTAVTFCILVKGLQRYPEKLYRLGADVIVSTVRRNPTCPLAAHKTLSYWVNLIARKEAADLGARESILLDTRGYVAEGSCTNLFFVSDGCLNTPSLKANILPGITRAKVMELASASGLTVGERMFRLHDMKKADEAFMTNALMGIIPIRSIDGIALGKRGSGRNTRQLMKAYEALINRRRK